MKKRNTALTVLTPVVLALILIPGITACVESREDDDKAGASKMLTVHDESLTSVVDIIDIDPDAGEYVPPETSKLPAGSGIAIPGWGDITIPANETEIAVDFPNPPENRGKYYLTFSIRLVDTGEMLYSSGRVLPGHSIQSITLSRPLEAGRYGAIIHVQPYKMGGAQAGTNSVDVETVIIAV